MLASPRHGRDGAGEGAISCRCLRYVMLGYSFALKPGIWSRIHEIPGGTAMSIDPKLLRTETRIVRKARTARRKKSPSISASSGFWRRRHSAALEAAKLGRKVALIDACRASAASGQFRSSVPSAASSPMRRARQTLSGHARHRRRHVQGFGTPRARCIGASD